jgi:hypothetical protein
MNTILAPADLNHTAIQLLVQSIGIVNTIRFINQFTTGYGNYTVDRDELLSSWTVDDVVNAIQNKREHQQLD